MKSIDLVTLYRHSIAWEHKEICGPGVDPDRADVAVG